MRNRAFRVDIWLLIPVVVLLVLSCATLFSINPIFFRSQLIAIIVSLAAFLFFSQIDIDAFKNVTLPIYIASLVALGIILLIGIEARGAARWIQLFGVSIQVSEVIKPLLAVAFASYLAERTQNIKTFFMSVVLLFPVALAIDLQPDLGNALIFVGVTGIMLLVYGFPFLWFFLSLIPFVLVSPFLWVRLHDYQRQRVLTFLNPTGDPLGTSYNVIQAIIAVGSGGFLGRGLSESTQSGLRFLPERHTDFIFASLSEGLGLVGSICVILAFTVLLYRIYTIFRRTDSTFTKLFTTAAFSFLIIQFFVNVGMNIGIMPIVGVTLPFVSFGGSSLLANFIFLGMLSSISVTLKERSVLEIR